MPYVLSSGDIAAKQPWGMAKLVALFWGVLNFFFMFFRTLLNPAGHARGDRYTQDFRGPGGGPGPAGPKPPKFRRRMGGIGRMSDIGASPCANGACGM